MKDLILSVIGINHNTSSVEEREKFQLGRKELPIFLTYIFDCQGIEGCLVLATCNRIEFYLVHSPGIMGYEIVSKSYESIKNININNNKNLFYTKSGIEVTEHLFKVISGLDSLVLGEYQIQGQVKEAYSVACEYKTVDKYLHKLLHAAFRVGKKIRTQTTIGEGKQSVSGVASQIIINKLKPSESITIIGVNENSKILATELTKAGFTNFIFCNRTEYKAQMLAEQFGGKATSLNNLEKNLFDSVAVFSSTGAPGFIVSSEMLKRLCVQERCPRLIVDMAIPRDIDTSGLNSNIEVYDIGALKKYLENISEQKTIDLPVALKIIEDEVQIFQAWTELQTSEFFQPFAEKFEITRQQVIDEYKSKFTEHSLGTVDKLTKQLIHRLQSCFINSMLKQQSMARARTADE